MEEDDIILQGSCPNDWMDAPSDLPDMPQSLLLERFKLLFALDVNGNSMHDMYVAISPNQVHGGYLNSILLQLSGGSPP